MADNKRASVPTPNKAVALKAKQDKLKRVQQEIQKLSRDDDNTLGGGIAFPIVGGIALYMGAGWLIGSILLGIGLAVALKGITNRGRLKRLETQEAALINEIEWVPDDL
jgi:hypothetical protein